VPPELDELEVDAAVGVAVTPVSELVAPSEDV
jgi:hypothetical protein